MEHVFGPTNQIEILTGTTFAYTEGVMTFFEIKYNVSTHMRTAYPNSLSLGSPAPQFDISLLRVCVRSQHSMNAWFEDAEIWSEVRI